MLKRIFLGLFFFCTLILILHFSISFNQGFSLKKVLSKLSKNKSWVAPIIEKDDPIMLVLDKPFTYLGRGGQAFVFESENQEYVIKLIRYDLLTPTLTMRLNRYFFDDQAKFDRKKKRYLEANQSYYHAYSTLSDETNVVYSHLVTTDFFHKKVTLIDNLGKKYHLDLDSLGFVLQKKVALLGDVLKDLKNKKNFEKIKEILEDYLTLLKKRSDKGFWIKDHNQFLRNYGLYKGKIYEIDVGSYRLDDHKELTFFQKNNLDHLKRLHLWIEENLPDQITFFDNKIQEIIL